MIRTFQKYFPVIGFFLLAISGLSNPAWATISISSTIDKTHITLEDTLTLLVRVNGIRDSSEPILPPLPDFQIQPQGRSSSIQVINGEMNSSLTFRYLLIPKKKGTFRIEAVRLEREGRTYESPPITVIVAEASKVLPDGDKAVFAETLISKTTAYLQEQISLTYRFYRKVEVRNLSLDAPLEHFRKVPLGEPIETSRVINGVRYYVSEIYYALYPMQAGVLKIPSATFQMEVVNRSGGGRRSFGSGHLPGSIFDDPFFSGGVTLERKFLRTKPIEIKVLPFPEKNKPDPFYNLVGPVTVDSKLSEESLSVGDTATWTLTLKGRGNMEGAQLEIPEDPSQYKIYKDQPVIEERSVNGFIRGTKTYTFALVPTKEGRLTLPPLQINFWDPEKKMYRSVSTAKEELLVRPGLNQQTEAKTAGRKFQKQSDISTGPILLPIHTQAGFFDEPGHFSNTTIFKLSALILPILGYLVIRFFYGSRLRMKHDHAYARKKRAYPKAVKRLKEIGDKSDLPRAKEVSSILREYLGDRFSFQGTALTPEEVENRLRQVTIEENHITATLTLLDKCQTVEFAPVGIKGNEDLVCESLDLIKTLEQAKR